MNNEVTSSKHPLIKYAQSQLEAGKQNVHLIEDMPELDDFISPLGKYPHAYVLACIMDRQITAKNAWIIPWQVSQEIGGFEMPLLASIPLEKFDAIFQKVSKHRFKKEMAKNFYNAINTIQNEYSGNAQNLWSDKPPSGLLICRFLRFDGVGVKIATMATNILVRQFHVQLADKSSIDISPDIQVMRIFYRLGLISSDKAREEAIYIARALNPEYPGIADFSCWDVGRTYCHPQNPECSSCPFAGFCNYYAKRK